MFEYFDPREARTRPPSIIQDKPLREQLEAGNRHLSSHYLQKTLEDLQQTKGPPKRRDSHDLYLGGLFEFTQNRHSSYYPVLTPTPPSTDEPKTPDSAEGNSFVSLQNGNGDNLGHSHKDHNEKRRSQPSLGGPFEHGPRRTRQKMMKVEGPHQMLRRSVAVKFYELDELGRCTSHIPKPRIKKTRTRLARFDIEAGPLIGTIHQGRKKSPQKTQGHLRIHQDTFQASTGTTGWRERS
jgi:hypothetical protein